ncbi:LPXTG cell wall anchor domain-containing protein [Dactylosporangium sucinum]|uniref:LPXTG-motif cell wall anchor domain-containing protein n=1 Tax=Dactylosporangium sucinum TaxID=1424081 RepID=A0A917TQ53_9ACTN|nr:LPXTG cell wall anchor domain-containing protein [Dactylosporangium sucinum]GGM32942.1 hypothetical protein GCM10007977_037910 [Dactylosporangium sucinum]
MRRVIRAVLAGFVAAAIGVPALAEPAAAADGDLKVLGLPQAESYRLDGQKLTIPLQITNTGTAPISSGWVAVTADFGLTAVAYQGCRLADSGFFTNRQYCPLNQELRPGQVLTFVTIQDGARTDGLRMAVESYVVPNADLAVSIGAPDAGAVEQTGGPAFAWVAGTPGPTSSPVPSWYFTVKTGAQENVEGIGGTIRGKRGDVVPLEVGIRNLGPAAILPPSDSPMFRYRIAVPAGTELVKLEPADPENPSCRQFGDLPPNTQECAVLDGRPFMPGTETGKVTLHVKITSPTPGTGGVTVRNKTTPITVEVLPAASPSASPSVSPSVSPSASGAPGGPLPVTGTNMPLLAGIGAALIAAGIALLVLFRRRRVVLTNTGD